MFARRFDYRRVAFAAAMVAAGCATTATGSPDRGEAYDLVIVIRNHDWNRATIYTTPAYGSRRLGTVAGNSVATFKLKWELPRIQLMAERQDRSVIRWRGALVKPGETWTFTISAR